MFETRDCAASWALRKEGMIAKGEGLDAFRLLIAPGETPNRASEMVRMSTCALFVSEYIRQHCARCPPKLAPPYVNTKAPANVLATAREASAVRPSSHEPLPGDIVHLSPGGGAGEHLYIVTAASPLLYGGTSIQSVDAGQKPDGVNQGILTRYRILIPQGDGTTLDDPFPLVKGGFTTKRPIFAIYDLEAIAAYYS